MRVECADDSAPSGREQWVLLADPSSEEEEVEGKREPALDGLVTVACDQFGNICYLNQVCV
jgi:microcompartment protein CcmK/EutM